jgi:large subunit ribosomal protein L4e
MKAQVLDINGKKVREITTNLFEEPIREDIIMKVVEAEKTKHPYSNKYRAGMDISASGALSKRRHVWKSDRGRGLSRLPRKTMSRRGTQFNWIGAVIPSARGGRRAHPPKGTINLKNVNNKELIKALLSSLSYTSSSNEIKKKYSSLKDIKIDNNLPIIVENKIISLKSKEFNDSLKKILGKLYNVAVQNKTQRAGRGKSRGRKYKKSAGLLMVIGKMDKIKRAGVDILGTDQLTVSDLASNGARLTIFTENAIKDLEKLGKRSEKISNVKSDEQNNKTENKKESQINKINNMGENKK